MIFDDFKGMDILINIKHNCSQEDNYDLFLHFFKEEKRRYIVHNLKNGVS